MPRTRRIALLAALAVVAALGLTACGNEQPHTAAYVGNVHFTDKQLDTMVAEGRRYELDRPPSAIRRIGLATLIVTELGKRIARDRGISIAAPDYGHAASALEMPASTTYVRAFAEFSAVAGAVAMRLDPIPVSDATLRPYFDDLVKTDIVAADQYSSFAQQVGTSPYLARDLALFKVIQEAARQAGLKVNPQYLPLITVIDEFPLVVATSSLPVKASPPARRASDPNDEEDPEAPVN
jgi:hypothetical protein